jgi:hypothetical protein
MSNLEQTKSIESVRELTLDEVQTVSGAGGDAGDDGVGYDGGGPAPTCPGSPGC